MKSFCLSLLLGTTLGLSIPSHAEECGIAIGEERALQTVMSLFQKLEQIFTRPSRQEMALAHSNAGVIVLEPDAFAWRWNSVPPPPSVPTDPNGWGGGEEPPINEITQDCESVLRDNLTKGGIARSTYWGKSATSAIARVHAAPERVLTNPTGLAGDLLMVFVSPLIKQSFRNGRLAVGDTFAAHTVVVYWPRRAMLNLGVSGIDSLLAAFTAIRDRPGLTRQELAGYIGTRFLSNASFYVLLDSVTSGIDDHIVLNRLFPAMANRLCGLFPNGKLANRLSRAGIVGAYMGLGYAWESFHFRFVRGYLFNNRDPQ